MTLTLITGNCSPPLRSFLERFFSIDGFLSFEQYRQTCVDNQDLQGLLDWDLTQIASPHLIASGFCPMSCGEFPPIEEGGKPYIGFALTDLRATNLYSQVECHERIRNAAYLFRYSGLDTTILDDYPEILEPHQEQELRGKLTPIQQINYDLKRARTLITQSALLQATIEQPFLLTFFDPPYKFTWFRGIDLTPFELAEALPKRDRIRANTPSLMALAMLFSPSTEIEDLRRTMLEGWF